MAGPDGRHSSSSRVTGSTWSIDPVRAGIRIIRGCTGSTTRRRPPSSALGRQSAQLEPINGNPFERQLRWGLTAGPVTYDPPVGDPKEFSLVDRTPPPDSPRPIASPYKLQAEPVHKWKNLQSIPIGWITSEFGAGGSPVANVEFLKQVGCKVEMLRLRDYGIYGNGNLMLMERNNHEVFTVIRDWLDKNVK